MHQSWLTRMLKTVSMEINRKHKGGVRIFVSAGIFSTHYTRVFYLFGWPCSIQARFYRALLKAILSIIQICPTDIFIEDKKVWRWEVNCVPALTASKLPCFIGSPILLGIVNPCKISRHRDNSPWVEGLSCSKRNFLIFVIKKYR